MILEETTSLFPQYFTETPNLFDQVLEKDLGEFQTSTETQLLQFEDNIITGKKGDKVSETIINLLNFWKEKLTGVQNEGK